MSVLNISKAEIDFHIIVSYNNFHLVGFGLQFWQALVRAKIMLSFKKRKKQPSGLDLKDSGGLRFESNHCRTCDHQSNY